MWPCIVLYWGVTTGSHTPLWPPKEKEKLEKYISYKKRFKFVINPFCFNSHFSVKIFFYDIYSCLFLFYDALTYYWCFLFSRVIMLLFLRYYGQRIGHAWEGIERFRFYLNSFLNTIIVIVITAVLVYKGVMEGDGRMRVIWRCFFWLFFWSMTSVIIPLLWDLQLLPGRISAPPLLHWPPPGTWSGVKTEGQRRKILWKNGLHAEIIILWAWICFSSSQASVTSKKSVLLLLSSLIAQHIFLPKSFHRKLSFSLSMAPLH